MHRPRLSRGARRRPIGKLRDGDTIRIVIDRVHLARSVDLVGEDGVVVDADAGSRLLASRAPRADLAADPALPDDTRLWAALQDVSGGPWGGSVYDVERILGVLAAGRRVMADGGRAQEA